MEEKQMSKPTAPARTDVLRHAIGLLNALIERKDLLMKEINELTVRLEHLGKEYEAHIALIKRITEFRERTKDDEETYLR
jgi:hypothetical protein